VGRGFGWVLAFFSVRMGGRNKKSIEKSVYSENTTCKAYILRVMVRVFN
jgi:hypothetical protein